MSDCLYIAWEDYIKWLGKNPSRFDYCLYRTSKSIAHGSYKPQYTFGGVVPWMLAVLGMRYGFHVRGEYRLYTPLMYSKIAPCKTAVRIVNRCGLGSYTQHITLSPAIYLDLGAQHATFSTTVPRGGSSIIAAYQYIEGVKDDRYNHVSHPVSADCPTRL